MTEIPSIALRFPKGLNNRDRETALPDGALRVARNLDVTNNGTLRVRDGLRSVLAGDWHSLYPHPHGTSLLAVKDDVLGLFDGGFTGLVAVSGPVRYCELNGEVFWTDGDVQGRIDATGALKPWGLNPPPPIQALPVLTGGMDAGTYQVTYTALVAGLESGAPTPEQVGVAQGGGIQVTMPAGSATFAVYVTTANGESASFAKVAELAGGATAAIAADTPRGKNLESLRAVKPFAADHLCSYKGRIWAATGSTVWFTDTLSPHWLFPENGFFLFDAPVTLLAPVEDGLYIAAGNRTWFLQGAALDQFALRPVAAHGAVSGTGLIAFPYYILLGQGQPPGPACAWLSTDGVFCIGRAGGVINRVTDAQLSLATGLRGITAFWEHDGLRSFLLATSDDAQVVNAVRDVAVLSVLQQGVVLGPS